MQTLENPDAMEYCKKLKEIEDLQATIKILQTEADELKPKVNSWLMETQPEQKIIFEDSTLNSCPMRLAIVTKPSTSNITKTQLEGSTSKYIHRVLASLLNQTDRTSLIEGIRDTCWNERITKPVQKLIFEPIKRKESAQQVSEVNEAIETLTQMSKKRKTVDLVKSS